MINFLANSLQKKSLDIMTCMIHLKNDNDDVNRDDEEKFGDLSRPLADQFTHLSCSLDTTKVLHCSLV